MKKIKGVARVFFYSFESKCRLFTLKTLKFDEKNSKSNSSYKENGNY